MKKLKSYLFTLWMLSSSLSLSAQSVEMADKFRGEGKIYVVVMVALILLITIFLYLFRLDKKLTKLEEDQNSEQ